MRPTSVERTAAAFELRGRTRHCAELVELSGKDVLNIGSSIGWFERHAVDQSARRVVGIDVDAGNLQTARAFVQRAEFVEASALDLPFGDASFDVVTMFDVIEHLPRGSEVTALREIRRVLRPDGALALSTPARHWFSTVTDPAWYLGHRHYRAADIRQFCRVARFDVAKLEIKGRAFDQIDLLLYYLHRHVLRKERHPFATIRRRADREWDDGDGWNTIFVVATPTGRDVARS
jgi:2-polyprenyl-3-methyl-5-hydroxy-6-metoxy-1,4-benzoquinol methylase